MQSAKERQAHETAYHGFVRMMATATAAALVLTGIVILLIS